MNGSKEMARLAVEALEDKKAVDIRVIDIEKISTLADYFIIASGTNRNQVQAMADNVDEVLAKAGYHAKQTEAIRMPTGFYWITAILLSICLMKKTVCSMTWSVSGETEKRSKKICCRIFALAATVQLTELLPQARLYCCE